MLHNNLDNNTVTSLSSSCLNVRFTIITLLPLNQFIMQQADLIILMTGVLANMCTLKIKNTSNSDVLHNAYLILKKG